MGREELNIFYKKLDIHRLSKAIDDVREFDLVQNCEFNSDGNTETTDITTDKLIIEKTATIDGRYYGEEENLPAIKITLINQDNEKNNLVVFKYNEINKSGKWLHKGKWCDYIFELIEDIEARAKEKRKEKARLNKKQKLEENRKLSSVKEYFNTLFK